MIGSLPTNPKDTFPYQTEIKATLNECEHRMREYGSRLLPTILSRYADAIQESTRSPSLIYTLPFSLGEAFGLEGAICRCVALASYLGLLHMTVQDDVMDQDKDGAYSELVPLATRLWTDSLHRYQTLFEASSSFWSFFDASQFHLLFGASRRSPECECYKS